LGAPTASVFVLRPILAYAATCGVNTSALLAEVGLTESALEDRDYRILDSVHERVWREAAARADDSAFGLHVAENAAVGSYDALEYALRFSSTLDEAFHRMSTFYRLLCDGLATTVEVRSKLAIVRRSTQPHGPQSAECFFAFLVLRARDIAGADLAIREVRFVHAAPSDVAPHAALFRCPVRFRQLSAEIVLDAADFTREVRPATPGLAAVLDRYMLKALSELPAGDSVMERVRRAVAMTLGEQRRPSLKSTALALKASPRTVQRWLEEDHTTHRRIADEARRDLALRLLDKRGPSITEIAFLLGFADVGGFERRFKRWTGSTPSSVRAATA
jgi:AraC-like DNA-binding protein